MRNTPRGVTMVELAVALGLVGILLAFAVPHYVGLVRHTHATQAMADLYAVRAAGYIYFAESGKWPREYGLGHTPEELVELLPRGFRFSNEFYQLDWENWRRPDGTSRSPRSGILVGVSVVTNDPHLLREVSKVISNAQFRRINRRKFTLEILGLKGL